MSLGNSEGFRLFDGQDPTKKVKFNLSGVAPKSTRTLTIPDQDGTILLAEEVGGGYLSRVSAYMSSDQSIPNYTYTKLQIDTKDFDDNNEFDAINHRWTCKATGYYFVKIGTKVLNLPDAKWGDVALYINGVLNRRCQNLVFCAMTGGVVFPVASALLKINKDDYLEVYGRQNSGVNKNFEGSERTHFMIYRVAYVLFN